MPFFNETNEVSRNSIAALADPITDEPDLRVRSALLAATGGISVIPVKAGLKTPAILDWPARATTDPAKILAWAIEFPNCNFGFVMGNGWVGLDLDRHHDGQDGISRLAELYPSLPSTFSVQTPRRGVHHYFRTPRQSLRSRKLGNGIEVQGEGTFLVGPYSEVEGRIYEPHGAINNAAEIPADLLGCIGYRPSRMVASVTPTRSLTAAQTQPDSRPLTSVEREAIRSILFRIDASLPYEGWYQGIFAVLRTWGERQDVIDLLREWSQESDKWDERVFDEKVASYDANHPSCPGLPLLEDFALRYPRQKIVVLEIQGIPEERVKELVDAHENASVNLLTSHGNIPSADHRSALREVSTWMVRGLYCPNPFRTAFPLETGMGKTTAALALCSTIIGQQLDKAVLLCAEQVDQLARFKASLLQAGIPENEIGLLHRSH